MLLDIPHESSPASDRVSITIGAALSPPGNKEGPRELLELADSALHEVKQGRHAVLVKDASAEAGQVVKGPWQSANEGGVKK